MIMDVSKPAYLAIELLPQLADVYSGRERRFGLRCLIDTFHSVEFRACDPR